MTEAWEQAVNVADFERLASERLDAGALGYFAGGAADEITLRDNVAGWKRWRLRPRVLVDVSDVSTGVELLGAPCSMPVCVAPVAFQRLVDPDGEVAMARAAAAAGTVMSLSTIASARPGEVAGGAPGGRRFFQLYSFRDEAVTRALVEEAVESGFEAILLTVDAPVPSLRERDLRTGFAVPPEVRVPSLEATLGGGKPVTVAEVFAQVNPALDWQDLSDLASECSVPVLPKGVFTAEDAALAIEHGAAGVVVSNHGGRQLDAVPASIEVLPDIADAVGGRIEVLMDGGVRRGTDVAVALALGASAVLVGRPALWGLAYDGEAGAARALAMLTEELRFALGLLGCTSPADLSPAHVRRRR